MRIVLLASLSVLLFSGCKKDNPEIVNSPVIVMDTSAVLKFKAEFMNSSDVTTSGTAEVFLKKNVYSLKLLNFKTSAGPDLHVLLSKEQMPVNYIDLGALTMLKGDQEYTIPGSPNFNEYKYVCIHCIQYNHLFGTAKIN